MNIKERRTVAGRWLRHLRHSRGLTQAQVAEALGYDYATMVSQVERGLGQLPEQDQRAYAAHLGMPPDYLVHVLQAMYDDPGAP